jgi:fructose-1,6-bisphosphatase/inositol monophosphatase family enzyme
VILRERYGGQHERTVKGRGNFVTETDIACEKAILEVLSREYAGVPVLSEETSSQEVEAWDRGPLWVVDPLDGTSNFSRGIPTFAVAIALCVDGEPVLGLTLNPVTNDEFLAVAGKGLTHNGEPARVSAPSSLRESLLGFGLGYDYGRTEKALGILHDLADSVMSMQNIGSAALGLAYAASGRFDVYLHQMLYPWDMAAGIIQVREGGGLVVGRDGPPVSIYSEGLIAGARGPVEELAAVTAGRAWR